MDVRSLTGRYAVRPLTEADIPEALRLCQTNPQYYRCFDREPSEEELRRDMTLLPPGVSPDKKHFLGLFQAERLAALLDLVEGYPTDDTAYIGLFMVDAALSGQGVGTAVVEDLCAALQTEGFARVRLAYGKRNPQSTHFWKKNGFIPREERQLPNFGAVIAAERQL